MIALSFIYLAIPLYMFALGASQFEIGLQGLIYYGVQAPLTPLLGRLSDRFGRERLLSLGLVVNAVSSIALIWTNSTQVVLFLGVILGVASAFYWPIVESLIADSSPLAGHGEAMGLYSATFGAALVIGPVMAGFLKDINIALVFAGAGLFSLIPMLFLPRPKGHIPRPRSDPSPGGKGLLKLDNLEKSSLIFASIAIFAYGLVTGGMFQIFPVYGAILGFTGAQIGLLLAVLNSSRIVANFATGRLSHRIGKKVLATFGVAISSSVLLISFFSGYVQLLCSLIILGVGLGIVYPASLSFVAESSSKRRGMMIGIFDAFLTVAIALGSQIGGIIADISVTWPYLFFTLSSVAFTLVLILQVKKK